MQRTLPIAIDTPCGADFASMTPLARRERLCTACDRKVHDLSGRTDEEVRALLAAGPACIRYLYDANGQRIDELPPGAALVPARSLLSHRSTQRWLRAAALASSAIVFEACGGNDGGRRFADPSGMPGYGAPATELDTNEEDAGADAADTGPSAIDAGRTP